MVIQKNRSSESIIYAIGTIIVSIWLLYMLIIYPIDYSYPNFFESEKFFLKSETGVELGFINDEKEYYGLVKEKADSNAVDIVLFTVNNGKIKYKDVYFNYDDIQQFTYNESPYYIEKNINEYTGQIPGFRRGKDMFLDSRNEKEIGILTKERQKKYYKIFPYDHQKLYSRDFTSIEKIKISNINMLKKAEKIPDQLEISEIRDGNPHGFEDELKDQIFALNTPLRTIVVLIFFPLYLIFVTIAYLEPGYRKFKNFIGKIKLKNKIKKRSKKQEEFMKKFLDPEYKKYASKPKKLKEIRKNKMKSHKIDDIFLDDELWKYSEIDEALIAMSVDINRDKADNYYFIVSFSSIVYKSKKNVTLSLHLKMYDFTGLNFKPLKYKDEYRRESLHCDRPYQVYVQKKLDLSDTLGLKDINSIKNLKAFKIPIQSIETFEGGERKYKLLAVLESEEGFFRTFVDFKFKFPKLKNGGK